MHSIRRINKESVENLEEAPIPPPASILQVRWGKVKRLGDEKSAIFKDKRNGAQYVGPTGLSGDEHVYITHGGIDRAVHQYAAHHYRAWRQEQPPNPDLFDLGAFGENICATDLDETNVCVGDLYKVGQDVVLQVSEPRNPCYKLNIRFEWTTALKRIQRTGRVGWNFRVLSVGYIKEGDKMTLIRRPNPKWSVLNIQRVVHGKSVSLELVQELAGLECLTQFFKNLALRRLMDAPKPYLVTSVRNVTPRVKEFTFAMKEHIELPEPSFEAYSYADITFGPNITRSYSIVSGDVNKFTLGVARDDNSRGGSKYMHDSLQVGDVIHMKVGKQPGALEHDRACASKGAVARHVVIIGGIGVTAFLAVIPGWEEKGIPFEIHYAVRSEDDAPFIEKLPKQYTKIYSKSRGERLNINDVIPTPSADGELKARIFCCGPAGLLQACKLRIEKLGYPEHLVHLEDFGGNAQGIELGPPFQVRVCDSESGSQSTLAVPADKTLLSVLHDSGFDVMSSCRAGGCGSCKLTLIAGEVIHKGSALSRAERHSALLSCVDRGVGSICIEID